MKHDLLPNTSDYNILNYYELKGDRLMDTNMMNQELKDFMTSISDIYNNNNIEGTRDSSTTNGNSTKMTVFNSSEFGNVSVIMIDGEPWMVGKDVAEALGYSNPRDALSKHVDDEDKNTVAFCDGNRGNPNMTIINESGLYSLAFSSKLPTAKKFRRWVTGTVLPTIRKTGGYILGEENMTSSELKNATARVLGAKLNEKIRQEQMDATSFVEFACEGKPVSWNPAQLMDSLLWRYASACCGNNIKAARHELYGNLNEYCGICLWKRRQDAAKNDCRMVLVPMYAFLSIEEQQLALLFMVAMCVYSGANVSDLLYKYCSPVLMANATKRIAG